MDITISTAEADATAALVGMRRAYQLLRHLELDEPEAADRLLAALAARREWVLLNLALTVLQNQTMKRLAPDRHLAWSRRQTEVQAAGRGADSLPALSAWTFASAELAVELLTEDRPDQAGRLVFYETQARTAFDGEEHGSPARRRFFKEHE